MSTRVAVNGFGRIGRGVLRSAFERGSDLEIVAVDDAADPIAPALALDSSTSAPMTTVIDGTPLPGVSWDDDEWGCANRHLEPAERAFAPVPVGG